MTERVFSDSARLWMAGLAEHKRRFIGQPGEAQTIQGTNGGTTMTEQTFSSVWDVIEDTPQQAASMRAKSELMQALEQTIRQRGMTQQDAAALFGVTQPRISDLMRGKIGLFSLDALMDMAATAGLHPHIVIEREPMAA